MLQYFNHQRKWEGRKINCLEIKYNYFVWSLMYLVICTVCWCCGGYNGSLITSRSFLQMWHFALFLIINMCGWFCVGLRWIDINHFTFNWTFDKISIFCKPANQLPKKILETIVLYLKVNPPKFINVCVNSVKSERV